LEDKDIIRGLKSNHQREVNMSLDYLSEALKPVLLSVTKNYKKVDPSEILQLGLIAFYENLVVNDRISLSKEYEIVSNEGRTTKISSYMYSIFTYKCNEESKKNKWLDYDDSIYQNEPHLELQDFDKPANIVDNRIKLMYAKLKLLGAKCQEILKLYWFDQLSHDEIANKLGYSNARTSKTTKNRCQDKLKEKLIHVN